jgi:hypothetical protein
VLLAVLAHVERDQSVLVVEQKLGECLGKLGLSDTRGAGEDERTARALRVFQTRAGAADRLRQNRDRFFLADDAHVQRLLHEDKPARLLLGQLEDRDAGRLGEDFGDESLVDGAAGTDVAALPLLLETQSLPEQLLLFVTKRGGLLEVLVFDRPFLLAAHDGDLVVELAQLGRRRQDRETQACAGLVEQVNRLVGQEAVAHVAVGEVRRRDDGAVGDRDLVERFVLVAQPLEDVDRVGQRGLVHLNRLEAALEGGVFLEVFAVLVESGRADRLQLAAGEKGLQNGCGVDGALRSSGTDQRVDLVDEDDDVAAGADLLRHLLQALFEVAAVTAAGDERAEVERVQLLVLQRLGHVALDDRLGEALDDGSLADAGLSDENRVVLAAAGEDLHDPLHLLLAPDDRVELSVTGGLREVASELVEYLRSLVGCGVVRSHGDSLLALVAREKLDHLLANAVEIGTQLDEHLGCNAFTLADEAEQDVLRTDVVVPELQRFAQAQLENLLRTGREGDVAGRLLLTLADNVLDLLAHCVERDVERLQSLGCDALTLVDEAEQNVLRADVVVVEHLGLFLGQNDDSTCSVGKSFKHVYSLSTVQDLVPI